MSLLDQASLIVTPNAYNVSKLYSVIPNTTLGDMTVSRALSATRVNEQKFIEIARTNLVLYSEQFDNASWQKVGGGIASAPVVTPNVETAPDGTMTADRVFFTLNGGTSSLDLSSLGSNAFTFTSLTRTQSVYIKTTDGTTRNFSFVSPTGISTSITVTSVYQRFTFTVPNGTIVSSTIRLRLRGSASGEGTATSATIAIWGAQYEEGSVATEYIPTVASIRTKFAGITQDGSVAQNIPRIDYPPLGGCPSILSEPARTNEILYSEEFDNTSWSKSDATISANATNSPSNTLTADKLIEGSLVGNHYVNRNITNSNSLFTFSVFAKKSERNFLLLQAFATLPNNFTYVPFAYFDLNNGTVGTVNSATASIQDYGDGWYRCTLNCTTIFSQLSTSIGMYMMTATANGVSSYLGNGTSGIFIWGAQAEAASTVTSYIPTTTATVLRNADEIKNTSATTLIGQTEGTIYAEVIGTKDILAVNKYICIIGGGSKSIHIAFYLSVINIVSSPPIDLSVSFTPNLNYKIAVCYSNTGNFRVYVNGFKYHEVNTYVPATFSTLGIGNTVGGGNQVNSSIKSAVLWKTALTDDQCILLTGPSFSTYPEMANNFPNTLIYTLQ
jgi:hypothetical protein